MFLAVIPVALVAIVHGVEINTAARVADEFAEPVARGEKLLRPMPQMPFADQSGLIPRVSQQCRENRLALLDAAVLVVQEHQRAQQSIARPRGKLPRQQPEA